MKPKDFQQYINTAKEYYYNKYPDKKSQVDIYLNDLQDAYNKYKNGIDSMIFKQVYLFLNGLYNIIITKYEEVEDLKRYSNILWIRKDNPYNKLQQYLSYYTYELPDYKNLLEENKDTNNSNNSNIKPTDEYKNLIENLFTETKLNEELSAILTDKNISNLFIDYAILQKHGITIKQDLNLLNMVNYAQYLGLKEFLEDFNYIILPGLKLEDLE